MITSLLFYPKLRFVPEVGLEPTSLARRDFESRAYTNSATPAILFKNRNIFHLQYVESFTLSGKLEFKYTKFV